MATDLLYLEDFDVTSAEASVANVHPAEDGQTVVELDRTCFYPRGGGQDWDTGTITSGMARFDVTMVRLDENGVVQHYGSFANGSFAPFAGGNRAFGSRFVCTFKVHSV